jgi:hypothetical protein
VTSNSVTRMKCDACGKSVDVGLYDYPEGWHTVEISLHRQKGNRKEHVTGDDLDACSRSCAAAMILRIGNELSKPEAPR